MNDFVGSDKNGLRDGEAESPGSLEVDHQLELGGLFDREIARLGALENLVDKRGGAPGLVDRARAVKHQPSDLHVFSQPVDRRQASLVREASETCPTVYEHAAHDDDHPICPPAGHCRESPVEVVGSARLPGLKLYFQRPRSYLRFLQLRRTAWIGRIPQDGDPGDLGYQLFEQLPLLADDF